MPTFDTGSTLLPDIGELSYNGCRFSPLFVTTIHGSMIKDDAKRTVKYMEYELTADGYVTMPDIAANPDNAASIDTTMRKLRSLLTAQAGRLVYKGRGFDLDVNAPGATYGNGADVAWGPVPELIEFQPLGGGRSAKVQWKVTTRLPEYRASVGGGHAPAGNTMRLLQFTYDSTVSYDESGHSSLTVNSTIEIPLTRLPTQSNRVPATTADAVRFALETEIFEGVDLSLFRVTHRDFKLSRDKRTLEITYTIEEKPYMDLPPYCTLARGNYSVKPMKAGAGLAQWTCTLRGTYTVRADVYRRVAWYAFLDDLRLRMSESVYGGLPNDANSLRVRRNANTGQWEINPTLGNNPATPLARRRLRELITEMNTQRALLIDFAYEEGMYLDSKTISFSATWKLISYFRNILLASGLWKKMDETDAADNNLWAMSVADISGSKSWLRNPVDPDEDLIVDFGNTVG